MGRKCHRLTTSGSTVTWPRDALPTLSNTRVSGGTHGAEEAELVDDKVEIEDVRQLMLVPGPLHALGVAARGRLLEGHQLQGRLLLAQQLKRIYAWARHKHVLPDVRKLLHRGCTYAGKEQANNRNQSQRTEMIPRRGHSLPEQEHTSEALTEPGEAAKAFLGSSRSQ